MIDTSVRYVRPQISVNVFRIAATATTSGISTAGSVPKTKNRITSEPSPPISASVEDARAVAAAARRRLVDRVATGQVRGHARGRGLLQLRADLVDVRRRGEARDARRVDLGEGRVPVGRDVGAAARRPERRDARARVDGGRCGDRALDPLLPGHVAVGVEDGHERRLLSRAEGLQGALVRLVGGVARDREALEPAVGDAPGGVGAEERQGDPDADHGAPAADDQVREPREQRLSGDGGHRGLLVSAVSPDQTPPEG